MNFQFQNGSPNFIYRFQLRILARSQLLSIFSDISADAAARVSAMEGEEQLQQAYAVLTGKRYPSSEQLPVQQRSSTWDVFRLFKPREREARFHRLVLGDAAKEVELLGEQLVEELRGALEAQAEELLQAQLAEEQLQAQAPSPPAT